MPQATYLSRIANLKRPSGRTVAKAAVPILGIVLARKVLQKLMRAEEEEREKTAARENQFRDGGLRVPSVHAYNVGGTPIRPQSTPTGFGTSKAKTTRKARNPSNLAYFRDVMKSIYNPGERPPRMSTVG